MTRTPRHALPPEVQLDLFGEVLAAEVTAAGKAEAAARRRAVFLALATVHPDGSLVEWTAPYDCGDGAREGDVRPGWRCWHCGQVEPGEYLLRINHGLDEDSLQCPPGTGGCTRLHLLANHARYAAARARAGGLDTPPPVR